jgi:predicted 3-demethylubiquinone-9 3-methyltransferase (glyoxalase superfamily)
MNSIAPFLMFCNKHHGKAEEAINFYISLFSDSSIVSMQKYGKDQGDPEGTVLHAIFTLRGQTFMAIDSAGPHQFTFTPAMSLYVSFDSDNELDEVFQKLSEGGMVMMGLQAYPFSKKFGWVQDRFGVSWQLNLAA